MAFGFIQKVKKVFSFGKKKVEEVPADDVPVQAQDAIAEAETAARARKEKLAAEKAAQADTEKKAADEKAEAERKAHEEAARLEAEKKAAEEAAAKIEAERLAAEEAARQEAERVAAEEALAKAAAEQKAAEQAAAKAEAERAAAEAEALRRAAEKDEAARKAAEEKAAEEAAEAEAAAKAAEEAAAKAEKERITAEIAAREEVERVAAEQKAAEEAAQAKAEQEAAEGAAKAEAERITTGRAAKKQKSAPPAPREQGEGKGERPVETKEPAVDSPSSSPVEHRLPEDGEKEKPAAPDKPPQGKVKVSADVKPVEEPAVSAPEPEKKNWFQRLKSGLSRSSKELSENIKGVFTKRKLDEDTLQDLEDVLIQADLGVETAIRVTDALADGRYGKDISDEEVRAVMADEIVRVLDPVALPLELDLSHKPHVILVVGVNGTGKTTTIGKLAAKLHEGGLSVTLAAGDTFRAAAIEQLKIWGERVGAPVISSKLGADAAGLAYEGFEKAKEAGSDVLIIDTAGRLQNKAELMDELAKIVRVLGKLDPEAPHTVLQTLDATTGQNALSQVEIFRNVAGVNGLVMTKLDGTARGGILVAIAAKHKLPVYFVGVGEQVDDLEPFSAKEFATAITGVA